MGKKPEPNNVCLKAYAYVKSFHVHYYTIAQRKSYGYTLNISGTRRISFPWRPRFGGKKGMLTKTIIESTKTRENVRMR